MQTLNAIFFCLNNNLLNKDSKIFKFCPLPISTLHRHKVSLLRNCKRIFGPYQHSFSFIYPYIYHKLLASSSVKPTILRSLSLTLHFKVPGNFTCGCKYFFSSCQKFFLCYFGINCASVR